MNKEEQEAIKNSKELINEFNNREGVYYKNILIEDILQILLNLISKQQKEIEYKDQELLELTNSDKCKLKKENEELNNKIIFLRTLRDSLISTIKEDYIPKTRIEEKIKEIEEYDNKYKTYTKDGRENFTVEALSIPILKELLESEDNK